MDLVARSAAAIGNALWRLVLGGAEPSASCEEEKSGAVAEDHNETAVESAPCLKPKHPLRCDFEGVVTSVIEGRLLVNGHIVVDAQLLKADVECGATLKGCAVRQTVLDNWTAVEVTVVDSAEGNEQELWDDVVPERIQERLREKSAAQPGKIVAMVTELTSARGVLNNKFHFGTGVCEPGFRALKGDWVLAQLAAPEDGDGPVQVARITVLRRAPFRGRVTGLTRYAGFVNRQIWFQRRDCESGFYPRVGDLVAGWCIESVQAGDCTFRALTVRRDAPEPMVCQGDQRAPSLVIFLPPRVGSEHAGTLDFGCVKVGSTVKSEVKVRNNGPVVLQVHRVGFPKGRNSQFRTDNTPWPKLIEPGCNIIVVVRFTARFAGVDQQPLMVEIAGGPRVTSSVRAFGIDPMAEQLQSNGIGRGRGRGLGRLQQASTPSLANRFVMPGVRPTTSDRPLGRFSYRLKPFAVPARLREILALPTVAPHALMETKAALEAMVPSLCHPQPTMATFVARWSILLHAEEVQEETDLRQYDIPCTTLQRKGDFLALKVNGLKEGRPSLMVGDRVLCSREGAKSDALEGFVHELRREEALLKFHHSVHQNFDPTATFRVEFTVNRVPYRRMHQALETAVTSLGAVVLYPELSVDLAPSQIYPCDASSATFWNPCLNAEQRAAVLGVLEGRARPRPYVIFGPPGTGKTTTLVEAALQLHLRLPGSRMLLTAPSNSAADLLCELMLRSGQVGAGEMVRLLAASRDVNAAPEAIRSLCASRDAVALAAMHRIVVATCVTSGILFSLGLPAGHFTHVLVDEAGQATEPECLIPMGAIAQSDGMTVLAGDPFQLGPVISSRWALRYGLQRSYLERLLSRHDYCRDESGFNPLLVTKLVRNYRAHPAILEPYSQLFYDNELQAHASAELTDRLLAWPGFPNPGFPLVFIGIRGSELRDPNSPSFFNPAEAVETVRVAGRLLAFGLTSSDLGIITPYRKQVEKIRELLASTSGADTIKVASVEEFQGQERPAIIVSTVRSDESGSAMRIDQALGFLTNPKRFNVTISRAQAALVVIGNPFILCNDPQWLHFLRYVIANGAYTGCDLDAISHVLKIEDTVEDLAEME